MAKWSRFLYIAMGSATEIEYHLLLAHNLGFLEDQEYQQLVDCTTKGKRMLASLIKKLQADC